MLVYNFNFDLFEFSAAILEKGLLICLNPIGLEEMKKKNLCDMTWSVWPELKSSDLDIKIELLNDLDLSAPFYKLTKQRKEYQLYFTCN